MESLAKSIVFSLPVTSTAGLRLLDEDEDNNNNNNNQAENAAQSDHDGDA